MALEQVHKLHPSAQDDFIKTVEEINALLAKLKVHADNHFGRQPDKINWGDVGDITVVRSQLQEAVNFVDGKKPIHRTHRFGENKE